MEKIWLHDGDVLRWEDKRGKAYALYILKDENATDPVNSFYSTIVCWEDNDQLGNVSFPNPDCFWRDMARRFVPGGRKKILSKDLTTEEIMSVTEPFVAWSALFFDGTSFSCEAKFTDQFPKQAGWIALPKEILEEAYCTDLAEWEWKRSAHKVMQEELARYNSYLTGNVYRACLYDFDGKSCTWKFLTDFSDICDSDDIVEELNDGSYNTDFSEALNSEAVELGEAKTKTVTIFDFGHENLQIPHAVDR